VKLERKCGNLYSALVHGPQYNAYFEVNNIFQKGKEAQQNEKKTSQYISALLLIAYSLAC